MGSGPSRARSAPSLALATFAVLLLSGCIGGGKAASKGFVPSDVQSYLGESKAWQPKQLAALGDPATSGLPDWTPQFDTAVKAYDFDGDGVDELVAQANDTNVYVFRAISGHVLAVIPTTTPPAWHIERVLNAVEVGVLRPGEPPSLVITSHAAYVSAWRFDPAKSDAMQFTFERQFNRRMTECHSSPGMDAKAAVGDLEGDGNLEIVVQTEETGFYALRADGTTLWKQCWSGGNSAPVIADLDGDGKNEVIVASDSGFVSVLAGATGAPIWTYDATQEGITPASISVSPTVADLDGIPPLEVLFTARNAPAKQDFAADHMAIFAVHQNPTTYQAELMWMRQPDWANPLSYTRLIVDDVDGDGSPDIFGMDWNTIGHIPGDWERLGPAHLFRLNAAGEDVWVREMDTWWSNQDIALVDLEGHGALSILANGPGGPYDGLWRMSAATGAAEAFLPLADWKMLRGPQLFDLRHDGSMQLVLPVIPTEGPTRGTLLVLDLGVPYNSPAPGHG